MAFRGSGSGDWKRLFLYAKPSQKKIHHPRSARSSSSGKNFLSLLYIRQWLISSVHKLDNASFSCEMSHPSPCNRHNSTGLSASCMWTSFAAAAHGQDIESGVMQNVAANGLSDRVSVVHRDIGLLQRGREVLALGDNVAIADVFDSGMHTIMLCLELISYGINDLPLNSSICYQCGLAGVHKAS